MKSEALQLTGTWEREGKNPLVGSLLLVFLCGSVYFLLQSLVLNVYVFLDLRFGDFVLEGEGLNYFELLNSVYSRYQPVILGLTGVSQYLLLLALPLWLFRKWHTRRIVQYFQYDRLPLAGLLLAVAGIVCIIPLVEWISRFFYRFFPLLEEISEASDPLLHADSRLELSFILLVISLTPAICEEALFRGYFQRTLQRRMRFPWHFLLSGLIFALYHQSPLSLPALFLVGAFLGYVYYSFASIYVSMACHLVYNMLLILIVNSSAPPALLFTGGGTFRPGVELLALLFFAGIVVLIYFYATRQRLQQEVRETVAPPAGETESPAQEQAEEPPPLSEE